MGFACVFYDKSNESIMILSCLDTANYSHYAYRPLMTVSHRNLHMPPPQPCTPCNHAQPPHNHAWPLSNHTCHPNHACPPATMHIPPATTQTPSKHAHPLATMHTPLQPCTPPGNHQPHTPHNHT